MLYPIFGIDLGSFPIYMLMICAAVLSAYIVFFVSLKKLPFSDFIKSKIRSTFFWSGITAALFSNLSNWILYPQLNSLSIVDRFTKGGFSFFFGMLCFFGVATILLRINKLHIKYCINLFVPPLLLAQCVARIGCSLSGCCYGRLIEIGDISFHLPIREFEALFALVMFFLLKKLAFNKRLEIYLYSYSIFRFLTDFLRGDIRESVLGTAAISPTQIAAVITMLTAGVFLFAGPIAKALNKEEALNKILAGKKDPAKKYKPLPVKYEKPVRTKPLKIIFSIFSFFMAIVYTFVMLNPFNMAMCDNVRYYLEDSFSFLFESGGAENIITNTSGSNIVYVTSNMVVDSAENAVLVLKETENLTDLDFKCVSTNTLANGNTYYTLTQTVSGKPIFGKNKVVVTDKNGNANYTIGDTAQLTSTKQIAKTKPRNSLTINEVIGDNSTIINKTDYWYETEDGLVDVYYAEIGTEDEKPIIGAIVDKNNNKVISFVSTDDYKVSTPESNNIMSAVLDIIELISAQAKDTLDSLTKKNNDTTEFDECYNDTVRALALIFDNSELSYEQFATLLESVYEIIAFVPNLNQQLFSDIVIEETKQTLTNEGYNENDISACITDVKKAFSKVGIKGDISDESVIALDSKPKKSSFKYHIDFAYDVDAFDITTEPNSVTTLNIKSKAPVNVSVHNEKGDVVTSMYVESEEMLTFHPEDGSKFTLQVSDADYSTISSARENDYKITLQSKEQKIEIPTDVTKMIAKINDCYASSDATTFMLMVADNNSKMDIEDSIGLGLTAQILDSCQSCIGMDQADTAKAMIASVLVPPEFSSVIDTTGMYGSELELTYVKHIETESGILLNAHVNINNNGYVYYNGNTYLQLEKLEDNRDYSGYSDQEVSTLKLMQFLFGSEYSITKTNTAELYSAFGVTGPKDTATTDTESLYALCENKTAAIDNLYVEEIVLNEEKARAAGHSEEKIEAFKKQIARQNISNLNRAKASLQLTLETIQFIRDNAPDVKLIYDFVTNPVFAIGDTLFGYNEIWLFVKCLIDYANGPADIAVSIVFDQAMAGLDTCIADISTQIQKIDSKITGYKKQLE